MQHSFVFQDENRFSEMMWKKMRDDNCVAVDRSISTGSLAGANYFLWFVLCFIAPTVFSPVFFFMCRDPVVQQFFLNEFKTLI